MYKKWQFKENNKIRAEQISEKFDIGLLVAQIIANKNLNDEEIKIFLEPTRDNFYDPFLLPDMENENIVIFGDYDVDGITSTTVLKKFLEERGLKVRLLYSK